MRTYNDVKRKAKQILKDKDKNINTDDKKGNLIQELEEDIN